MDAAEKKAFASNFYSRQVVMEELGQKGQQKLAKSKVAVVGMGGLGTVSSLYLALAGVEYLRLIDQDTVEIQNLHRQILYSKDDLDYPKAEVAAKRLEKLNPLLKAEPVSENLHAGNAEVLLAGVDCVVDGLDNMLTRYLVNSACVKLGVPYVFGAAIQVYGNVSTIVPGQTFCLECIWPGRRNDDSLKAAVVGVDPSVLGIVTSVQVSEAVRLLTHRQPNLLNKLMHIDLRDLNFQIISGSRQEKCSVCGTNPIDHPEPFL